jgi:hypothetical protein
MGDPDDFWALVFLAAALAITVSVLSWVIPH